MLFIDVINKIQTPAIKEMAMTMIPVVPEYFWSEPASTSGKYHPEFDLGTGGVMRHSMMVALCAAELALTDGLDQEITDTVIFAALYHDCVKEGWNDNGKTVHEHPLLAAALIRKTFPENKYAELAAHMIESHMGKWTTSKYSDVILPRPADDLQKLLSHADMLASRKWWKVEESFFG